MNKPRKHTAYDSIHSNGVAIIENEGNEADEPVAEKRAHITIGQNAIRPLNQQTVCFLLRGTTPFMQLRFSNKSLHKLMASHQEGSRSRSKKEREARNFDEDYREAMHLMEDGRYGIPASTFRNAMISACRTVGFKMTLAKLSVFVEADGLDAVDGTPLVHLRGEPEMNIMHVRNFTGVVDIRVRPMWKEWTIRLRVRFDLDQFSVVDVYNLLQRAGAQVGIGEGRPDSRQSAGLGYGLFSVETDPEQAGPEIEIASEA